MPAIDPARLKSQIERVLEHFETPTGVHRHLDNLFSQYANRALRFGEGAQSLSIMPAFHLPDPLMRQLKLDLNPLIKAHPNLSLELSDELWQSDYYEIRLVASHILSQVPFKDPEPILMRLKRWLTPDLEAKLSSELLSEAARNLASSYPGSWEAFLDTFYAQNNPKINALGVMGFRESLDHSEYSNLPVIFRKISPLLQDPQFELMSPLKELIEILAEKFPEETLYFLKQSIALSSSPILMRLIKQCLPFFEEDVQDQLKAALR